VSYIVEDDALVRQYRVYVDSLDGEQSRKQVLLTEVGDFKIEFRGKGDKWEESWNDKNLPRALKITLQLVDETKVSRIFLLPQVVS
jgi:type II secretion system protein J